MNMLCLSGLRTIWTILYTGSIRTNVFLSPVLSVIVLYFPPLHLSVDNKVGSHEAADT